MQQTQPLRSFNFTLKTGCFNINIKNNRKCLSLLHGRFPIKFVFIYNISLVLSEINFRSSHWSCSAKKDVLKYFAKSPVPENTLAQVFPVNFAKFLRTHFVQNTSLLLWTTASETSNTKNLGLIKRRSKVQEKIMSCERALNFDQ